MYWGVPQNALHEGLQQGGWVSHRPPFLSRSLPSSGQCWGWSGTSGSWHFSITMITESLVLVLTLFLILFRLVGGSVDLNTNTFLLASAIVGNCWVWYFCHLACLDLDFFQIYLNFISIVMLVPWLAHLVMDSQVDVKGSYVYHVPDGQLITVH